MTFAIDRHPFLVTGQHLMFFVARHSVDQLERQASESAVGHVLRTLFPDDPARAPLPFSLPVAIGEQYMQAVAQDPDIDRPRAVRNAATFCRVAYAFNDLYPNSFPERATKMPSLVGPYELNSEGLIEFYARRGAIRNPTPLKAVPALRRIFKLLTEEMPEKYGDDPRKVPLADMDVLGIRHDYLRLRGEAGKAPAASRSDANVLAQALKTMAQDGRSCGYSIGVEL